MPGRWVSTGNDLVARPGCGRRAHALIPAIVLAALAPVATAAAPPAQSGNLLTAYTAPATPPPATESTVRFFNRDIMTMRSTLLGRSPELRARTAEANIEQVVQRPGTPTVAFENIPQGSLVLLGGQLVAMYTPADLDALNHQTMAQARAEIARNLTQAVQAAERD